MTHTTSFAMLITLSFSFVTTITFPDERNPSIAPMPRLVDFSQLISKPLSPEQELATFKIVEGFKVELVASEPAVVDPVAMCFDARGRLFVCEMRGYPNGGIGTGNETRGKIKCLRDLDGDGIFETSKTFAEGLRFPMGITPYRNGVIVAVAPDIVYYEDTDHDDQADKTVVLYSGFNVANIQQMVNSLQWGVDNWVYGCAGSDGGTIRSLERPQAALITLGNHGFRFKPDVPASLEPTSGGGQYGLTTDDFLHWFTATNSQHLRQIVLPAHYLKRNPLLPVSAVTLDIAEHGAAAKVYRISPFEPWRLERTTRRAGGPDANRFPKTELVPGGFFTSACSPLIYTGGLFPSEFYGNNFVCDPANNLIHRELLHEHGSVFRAVRAYPDREFLASTDNWFRPVQLSIGPDGAVYVLDFYREVIETPLSLPDDIKKRLNLESRDRGRIWRIAPTQFKPTRLPDLCKCTVEELIGELTHANSWRRKTAQRLLIENKPPAAVDKIRNRLDTLIQSSTTAASPALDAAWVSMLWTLHGLDALKPDDIIPALRGGSNVRETALRLAEPYLTKSAQLQEEFKKAGNTPRVRFQQALSAGFLPSEDAARVLHQILREDAHDSWTVIAALSSTSDCTIPLAYKLVNDDPPNLTLINRVAALIGVRGKDDEITATLRLMLSSQQSGGAPSALIEGLGQGMQTRRVTLASWLTKPPPDASDVATSVLSRFEEAAIKLKDHRASETERIQAARLLGYAPFSNVQAAYSNALLPSTPVNVQLAAISSLARHSDHRVSELLLNPWKGYGPSARAAALEVMLARADRCMAILLAMEKGELPVTLLSPAQVQHLKGHPDPIVRSKAQAVLKQTIDSNRAKVIAAYSAALELKGNPKFGQTIFQKHCSSCHRLDGVGHDVGANLLATLGNKSGEDLLIALFDPNREVDPRYVTYQVGTSDDRIVTGVVIAESPTSITLRRAEGVDEVILRSELAFFRSTTLSLMPEGFEKELKPQDVADLFSYLRLPRK